MDFKVLHLDVPVGKKIKKADLEAALERQGIRAAFLPKRTITPRDPKTLAELPPVQLEASVEIIVPEGEDANLLNARAQSVIEAHAPEKSDEEEFLEAREKTLEARVARLEAEVFKKKV